MKKIPLSVLPAVLPAVLLAVVFSTGTLMVSARSQSSEFRVLKMPGQDERVTVIHCANAKACVIGTDASGPSHIYSSDGQKITGTLVMGDNTFGEKLAHSATSDFWDSQK